MRIIVMGTGPFAVPTCERLVQEGHDVPLVVTRPLSDPPPKKLPPRPVFDWASGHKLPIFEPASINEPAAIERLKEFDADLFFVCDYGQILSKACLQASKLGGINLHGSLLPRHRGAAPVQWTLLAGDELAGVTVIHMTPRLDAGPSLTRRDTIIQQDETAEQLEPRLAELGVDATMEAVEMLTTLDGNSELGLQQTNAEVTRAPRFQKSDGQLDFRLSADYLVRLIKACQPWPGTFAELKWASGKQIRVIIRKASYVEATEELLAQAEHWQKDELSACVKSGSECGRVFSVILDASDKPISAIAATTSAGLVLINTIQPAGKRAMEASEFLRGHPLNERVSFMLPEERVLPLSSHRK